ncbi:FAD-dependent monooxygenase [Enemella evansiae]|uniref:FAD-dependent monooxygenase n=1 Tax=Enemella evansiae TaxID=2016499 RepID=UPI000B95ED21|nr:FAD-dependent monooxygenase [Enemella evansiae]OYO06115.1 4-oxoquinaldine-3-monooxygenase [Enemella evansiae]
MVSSSFKHAEVVGAGIGGLTAAAALARRGWSVRLHESTPQIRAVGAGIYLWSNGLAVLEHLGVLDQAIDGAHYGSVIQSRDDQDRLLSAVPINGPGQAQVLTILRERLLMSLLHAATAAGVEVLTGSTAVRATPDGRIEFSDGSSATADLVVAADGVGSRLRDGLGLLRTRRGIGQRCARLLIPRQDDLIPNGPDDYIEYLSGRRFLLYTPSSATDLYVALVAPTNDTRAMGAYLPQEEWIRSFPHLEDFIRKLERVPRWDDFEYISLSSWSRGRVAVLGDAAHAQPPYLGQGGGCAMMSAIGLADAVSSGQGSREAQLRTWEARERPLITHTQRFSVGVALLNDVPDLARRPLLSALGRSTGFGRSRLRAARATPTSLTAAAERMQDKLHHRVSG